MKKENLNSTEETLLEGIANDEILETLRENLKETTTKAQSRGPEIEQRMARLMDRIEKGDFFQTPIDTLDIDEIENAAEHVESKEMIERKLLALRKAKDRSWVWETEYRKAMLQYLTYVKPIITDLEDAKLNARLRINALREVQTREMNKLRREYNGYENLAIELLTAAGLQGLYIYGKSHEAMFGRIPRADYAVEESIREFEKPAPTNSQERKLFSAR